MRYPSWSAKADPEVMKVSVIQKFQRFQWESALIFSESGLFRPEGFSAEQLFERIISESALLSADFFYLWNIRFSALIYSESALILTHVDENIKMW